jgi:mRNA-capping enzyme
LSNWSPDSEDSSEIVSCLRHLLLWVWLGQALRMFAEARPPGIYKQDYIDKLFTFYHERKPQSLVCPSTPEWKRPATVDLNEVASTDQDDDDEDDGGLLAALQEVDPKPEMTNDDVLGDAIPDEHQRDMQKICYWALGVVSVFLRALLHYR